MNKTGLSPGSLIYVGPSVKDPSTDLRYIRYNHEHFEEQSFSDPSEFPTDSNVVHWLNVDGVHDPQIIEAIGNYYDIHALALEDIMNTYQEAKIEVLDNNALFIVLKMIGLKNEEKLSLDIEQVSFILDKTKLITFQEKRNCNIFLPIETRLKASVGKTRRNEADYLLFTTIDLIVDNYLLVLDKISSRVEKIEAEIFENVRKDPTNEIYRLKRTLTVVRKHASPIRDVLHWLIRNDQDLIRPSTIPYLKDVLDHFNQVMDDITTQREILNSLADIHYSILSNRMNSVMKTLTIFSAIFMPLTFIAGIYGMNFDYIPELHEHYGYYAFWVISVVLVVGQLYYFRRRGWL